MRLRIVNATVVTSRGSQRADVFCRDGLLERIGAADRQPVDEVIDAHGLLLFPGFIDPHVHSRDPGLTHKEDFAHSTRAAAAGGVTTLLEMPNAIPPVSSAAIFEERAAAHGRVASVDFGLWGLALGSANLADIAGLFDAGVVGVKLFWGYALHRLTHALVYNLADEPAENLIQPPGTGDVLELCREVARVGGLLAAHCEDRELIETAERSLGHPIGSYTELLQARPDTAESVSIAIAAELSAATDCRFHVVHTTSARGIQAVRRAQAEGVRLTAETCPHYLQFSADDFAALGALMKVYPPIRSLRDQTALWHAVRDGTIDSVGSDHAPHTLAEKALGLASAPAGVQGVETIGAVMVHEMLNGRISADRLAWVLAEGTARLYGLYPRKGVLEVGSDADFTLVDPAAETLVDRMRLHSKQPHSPWHGQHLRGRVRMTILRGEIIARDGEPVGEPRGRLVRARHRAAEHTPSSNPLAFTAELDAGMSPDVMPATVFGVGDHE
ncbi:MAG: amidohydrolase family protein [Chloroflexi bacterium]|nr:amidohydrolase family protein [Chloroflexota bacterium]